MAEDVREPDASSIKAVSSLRSQFEALGKPPSNRPAPAPKPSHLTPKPRADASSSTKHARPSLDGGASSSIPSTSHITPDRPLTPTTRRRAPSPPKPRTRPISMLATPIPPLSAQMIQKGPLQSSPPRLSVSSPTSPPPGAYFQHASSTKTSSTSPATQTDGANSLQGTGHHYHHHLLEKQEPRGGESHLRKSVQALDLPVTGKKVPPPAINRAAKPSALNPIATAPALTPTFALSKQQRKVSPFNTPPDSDQSSPEETPSETPSPPPLPLQSKPTLPLSNIPSAKQFAPHPTHHTMAGKRRDEIRSHDITPQRSPTNGQITRSRQNGSVNNEALPALPPRRQQMTQIEFPRQTHQTQPEPVKRSALSLGFSAKSLEPTATQARQKKLSVPDAPKIRSRTPPTIVTSTGRRSPQRSPMEFTSNTLSRTTNVGGENETVPQSLNLSAYPDSSRANRRPPTSPNMPKNIHVGYDTKLFDICGDLVCATGFVTRVWNVLSGKLLLSISHATSAHGDAVKVTALSFKPARKIEDDGARLWLGTNWGEMLELDIASKRIVNSNPAIHNRREIVKILRHGTELWSLDEEGKLYVWPPDDTGTPDMSDGVANGRVPRRATTCTVIGDCLWLTYGKEIRIVKPSAETELSSQQASPQKALLHAPGDISSAATIIDQPNKVYLGQADGKICIFSTEGNRLLEIVTVSLYKISCLVGVGSYLWSGQSTGAMFVYDTRSKPWIVKKEWPAHDAHISGVMAEPNSLWKLDRLPVLSLGSAELRIWDGMLHDDWLEEDMGDQQSEYCDFKDLKSLVVTWNVGASKPADLRYDEEDSNFFRELFQSHKGADIIAFGLQELVDLEDKKLTAKSFFKSKQKDMYGQEHLGSVYRAWRDHLSRCLDEFTHFDEAYTLLHTASLVGLFSCIFIKASLRSRVKDVEAAEIKTGMGGLHGNKGAIVIRLILDDSSICFVNCHLAAGQNQTVNRNNDIASILETTPLSPVPLSANKAEVFMSGGDGSMVLDSESCILNGDLNYRIDAMSRDTIVSSIKQQSFAKALERDQLLLSKNKYPGFRLRSFNEGQISFAPTYKYDVGSDNYDTSEKRRAPAWCDRILYRGEVRQLEYRRHEVRTSDHRPVSSRFEIKVKTIRPDLRAQCVEQSQQRFETMKKAVSDRAKLDYLHEVFGLSPDEGRKLLGA